MRLFILQAKSGSGRRIKQQRRGAVRILPGWFLRSVFLCSLLLCFLQSSPGFGQGFPSISEKSLQDVARSKQWRNLLHYRKKWLRAESSEVDGAGFFFSPDGKWDAEAELRATLQAALETHQIGPLKQSALCAFPARYRFLEKALGLTFPDHECEKLDEFLKTFHDPKSVSVIFSSAYANNPASMFGHLFLKIGSARSSELLDMGINFAAAVSPDENPFAFVYFGVVGGYQGRWSTEPFYRKVNEYVRAENRDLWDYELNMTADEARMFVEHLWELETTSHFWYYFFDENCAYQIMRAIEAVKPEWNLGQHTVYAIPGEIIKNITSHEGVVRSVKFRPSSRRVMLQSYGTLIGSESKDFHALIKNERDPSTVQSVWTLDAAGKYLEFLRQKNEGYLSEEQQGQRNRILSQRAALGPANDKREIPEIVQETRPDWGHDAYEISWKPGLLRDVEGDWQGFQSFKLKTAYHDLLNNDLGFTRYSEIDFPWLDIRYYGGRQAFQLEELGGLRITSINPLNGLEVAPSWKFYAAIDSPKDYGCLTCRHASVEAGLGLALETFDFRHVVYGFVSGRGEASDSLSLGYRLLPGLEVGFLGNPWPPYKFQLLVQHQWDVSPQPVLSRILSWKFNQSFALSKDWEIRQEARQILDQGSRGVRWTDASLSLKHFFR